MSKDEYVLFDADFDKVKLETTRTISIDSFVDEGDIDRLYLDDPFYVVPEPQTLRFHLVGKSLPTAVNPKHSSELQSLSL